MRISFILGLAFGAAAVTDATAQNKTPDALYEKPRDNYKQFESLRVNGDSLVKSFNGFMDSIKVNSDGSITGYGTAPGGVMPIGTLLDNRSSSDGYMMNGTRYFIRNVKPQIESKEVSPGSNIYKLR